MAKPNTIAAVDAVATATGTATSFAISITTSFLEYGMFAWSSSSYFAFVFSSFLPDLTPSYTEYP